MSTHIDTRAVVSRREERRRDRAVDAAQRREDLRAAREEGRADRRDAALLRIEQKTTTRQARMEAQEKTRKLRAKRRTERRKTRTRRWTALRSGVEAHMPLPGLPVVAVSLVMGWSGQTGAALVAGMGPASVGVPVLTEGMTLTLAGLTAAAITHKRPYRRLLVATWASALVAAGVNAAGHLLEDSSGFGIYRAVAFAAASLAALILWGTVMRSRRAVAAGKTAAQLARQRRMRRRHPILSARARGLADSTGTEFETAFATVWERRYGVTPGEPTVRELRSQRRAQHRRRIAVEWDGAPRRRWRRTPAPIEPVQARTEDAPDRTGEPDGARTDPRTDAPASAPYPQVTPRTAAPRKTGRTAPVHTGRRGVRGPDAKAFEDAELERTRQRAEEAYADSLDAGAPIGPAALGREFGFSEGWARKRIKAVDKRRAAARPGLHVVTGATS
ncbi:hypothetical protein [Streptomyces reniochalinae]|uniref:DUF2637 domain-containing protein n=1 Tax=Streptomyces reniochalinae TaxID=2250578 RepID=A0A367E836_9ACTN|nr:hypothetical protein [Streptomyces reniochalinae]RCG14181.1 hypothetical protein DQ392_29070 [Streptomyces reniochalinae]